VRIVVPLMVCLMDFFFFFCCMDGCSSLNLKAFTKILKKFVKVRHNILPTSEHIFNKEHILISCRYQLYPASATMHCPSDITSAHSKKKKEELQKRKVPL
jgi:hypothetical protein